MKYFWIKSGFTSFVIKYTVYATFYFNIKMYNRYISEVNKDVFDMLWYLRESKQLPLKSKERQRKGRKVAYQKFGALMRYYWI